MSARTLVSVKMRVGKEGPNCLRAACCVVRKDVSHGVSKIFREEDSEKKEGKAWFSCVEL